MLLLSRKKREAVVIGAHSSLEHQVTVTVLEISGNHVKLGFEAHGEVPIQRMELWQRLHADDHSDQPADVRELALAR